MEINKILFEQLAGTKGINNPFEDFDVNNDGVINEEDAAVSASNQALSQQITNLLGQVDCDEDVKILGDFVENEIPTNTVTSVNTASNASITQGAVAITQLEINKISKEQEKISDEIKEKEKQLKDLQKEIENKQEEYDSLISQAQSNNDNSKADAISSLSAEIKSLSTDISGLNSEISALQNEYNANATRLTSMNATLQIQQNILTETLSQTNAVKTVSGINEINALDKTDKADEATTVTQTTSTTQTHESPKIFEYFEKLDCKFNELWEQFGNREDISNYVKEHADEFMDITGDGIVDAVDHAIIYDYRPVSGKDNNGASNWFKNAIMTAIDSKTGLKRHGEKDTNTYAFEDMEELLSIGLSNDTIKRFMPQMFSHIDKNKIVQSEDWESNLNLIIRAANVSGYAGGNQYEKLIEELKTAAAENVYKVDAADCVTAADRVSEISEVSQTAQTSCTNGIKTKIEYTKKLDSMFDELYEKFCGNKEEIIQYVKNNLGKYLDITGDGKTDLLDFEIIESYRLGINLGKKAISSEKGENYFSVITQFANEIRRDSYITSGVNSTTSYTFDDIENLIQLGGKNRVAQMVRSINKTKVVQTENWESRLETISRFCGGNNIKQFQEIADYIKKYPEKAKYASIAVTYQGLSAMYENVQVIEKERAENAKNAYEDYLKDKAGYKEYVSDLKKDYPHAPTPTMEEYATHMAYNGDGGPTYTSKSDYYASNAQQFKKTDINGDGVFDANDIKELSTDIDLDGDGQVSCEEKAFISEIKSAMEAELYRTMKINSRYNATNINDVISYFENVDHNSMVQNEICKNNQNIDETAANSELKLEWSFGSVPDVWYKNGEFIYDRADLRRTTYTGGQYMDGTTISPSWKEYGNKDITVSEAKSLQTEAIINGSVEYTFLHYVQSADLSKDELKSILSKISGSSIATQYKLAEVKKAVETKLAGME